MHEPGELSLSTFTEPEKRALAGLVRLIMAIDGTVSFEERIVLAFIANRFVEDDAFFALLDEGETHTPDEAAVKEAARQVTRPEARRLFREIVGELAEQGGVETEERALLDWLDATWA